MWKVSTKIGKIAEKFSLYPVISTNQPYIIINFLDFNHVENHDDITEMRLDSFKKEVKIEPHLVEIKDDDVENSLLDHINLEFVKIIKELAYKNREENIKEIEKFDIDLKEKYDENLMKYVCYNLKVSSLFIVHEGRIGPGQYIITSDKTNDFLLSEPCDNFKYFVNKELKDNEIIIGRKNDPDQSGVVLVLNEESINDVGEIDNKKYVKLKYNFATVGSNAEKQYIIINKK